MIYWKHIFFKKKKDTFYTRTGQITIKINKIQQNRKKRKKKVEERICGKQKTQKYLNETSN